MRATVYVDGFNLYYGVKRWRSSRWLDLGELSRRLFPNDEIHRIRYFTARVKGKHDPSAPLRQQSYLRALSSIPNLTFHFGTFLVSESWMPLAFPSRWRVPVLKTEEKGSDVNLATFLLLDVFQQDCEMAVVLSNDSDLKYPIEIVQGPPFNVPVWVVNPHTHRAAALKPTHHLDLHRSIVLASQFPRTVQTPNGKLVTRPASWA